MTSLELRGAIDIIKVAHAACEDYHEQYMNDVAAQADCKMMTLGIEIAESAAGRIQANIDSWNEMAKAIQRRDDAELRRLQWEQSGV